MTFSLWDFKARFYGFVRSRFPFSLILAGECRNLSRLIESIPVEADWVLDVGAGSGNSLRIYPAGWFIVGMDESFQMVRRATRVRADLALVAAKGERLPVADSSVILISAIGLVEYLDDPDDLLIEAARVVQPGGWFLSTIAEPGLWSLLRNALGHRIHPLDAKTWETLLGKHGFEIAGQTRTFMQRQYLAKRV
jgi:ubiquinone/menaquinone biosynthesis C-methylase UbiE